MVVELTMFQSVGSPHEPVCVAGVAVPAGGSRFQPPPARWQHGDPSQPRQHADHHRHRNHGQILCVFTLYILEELFYCNVEPVCP